MGSGPDLSSLSPQVCLLTAGPLLWSVFVSSSEKSLCVALSARRHEVRCKCPLLGGKVKHHKCQSCCHSRISHTWQLLRRPLSSPPDSTSANAPLGWCSQSPMPVWSSFSMVLLSILSPMPSRPLGSSLTSRRALPRDP